MSNALANVRRALARSALDGIIITRPENLFYASSFTGSSGTLLVTADRAVLLTDFRYVEQARNQAPGFVVVRTAPDPVHTLAGQLDLLRGQRIGFESDHTPVSWLKRLESKTPPVGLLPVEGFMEEVRAQKDPAEIERIAVAAKVADDAFECALGKIRPGAKEIDIALEIEFHMRRHGAQRLAFDIIVASGKRSSMPHGRASDKAIEEGDFVTIDYGAQVDGYCSDATRTVIVGRPSPEQRAIYDLVLRSQLAALEQIGPGRKCREIDATSRRIIEEAGHAEHYGHGLGHGVGVVVHESPRLSPEAGERVLVPGNVLSVEPGVYIPEWGGVRIEDLVAITDDGYRDFTRVTKELIEIA